MLGFGYGLMVSWLFCSLCFTSSEIEDEPNLNQTFFARTKEQEHDLASFTKFNSKKHRQNVEDDFI